MEILKQKITRKLPRNFAIEDKVLFECEIEKTIPTVKVSYFNNVTIYPEQILLRNRKPIEKINTRAGSNKFKINTFKNLRRKSIFFEKVIWLTDIWSINYFHWFTDVLPRLIVAQIHFKDIPVLIPAYFDQYQFITDSLKIFDLEIIWLRNYQKAKAKELIYIPHTAPTGNYNESIIKEVREIIMKFFDYNNQVSSHKLMINRQNAPNRKILNFDEIIPILKEYNIEDVGFENYSWPDQVKKVSEAKLLIGIHGAGLTNMLFMKPGTNIIELRRKDDDKNNCYFSLASALNLNYYYLLCEVDDFDKFTQQNNFFVSPDKLKILLNNELKEIY